MKVASCFRHTSVTPVLNPGSSLTSILKRTGKPKPPPIPTYALEGLPPSGETGRQLAQRPDADRSRVALSPQAGDRRSRLKVATSLGFGLFVAAGLSTTLGISVLWLLQERGDGVAPRSQKAQGAPPVKMVKATQVPTIPPVSFRSGRACTCTQRTIPSRDRQRTS